MSPIEQDSGAPLFIILNARSGAEEAELRRSTINDVNGAGGHRPADRSAGRWEAGRNRAQAEWRSDSPRQFRVLEGQLLLLKPDPVEG